MLGATLRGIPIPVDDVLSHVGPMRSVSDLIDDLLIPAC